jgi:hypothetical protein
MIGATSDAGLFVVRRNTGILNKFFIISETAHVTGYGHGMC